MSTTITASPAGLNGHRNFNGTEFNNCNNTEFNNCNGTQFNICNGTELNTSMDPGFLPHSQFPYGSDGSGYYSMNSICSYDVMEDIKPTVYKALEEIPVENGRPFVMCDFGAADGGVSMDLIRDCIRVIRQKHGDSTPIQVIYEDQPVNDFKSVFLRVHGLFPGVDSYLKIYKNVFVYACGTNFYSQCLPDETLHFGLSVSAMHWLSKRPGNLTGVIHSHMDATCQKERKQFQDQAAKDWETILLHRAKELVPGGHMVVVSLCADANGHIEVSKGIKYCPYQTLLDCMQEAVDDGEMAQEELYNMTFNFYFQTIEEFSAPFNDPDSRVSRSGLKLVSIKTNNTKCPFSAKWLKSYNTGDAVLARKHAEWYVPSIRTWSNHSIVSCLSDIRSEVEKDSIVDSIFERYVDKVAASPGEYGADYLEAQIHFRKEKYDDSVQFKSPIANGIMQ